jgi:hypothetical protein
MDLTYFLLEIALLALLGLLYYLYQRRRILREDRQKGPLIMGYLLQSILAEKGETPDATVDTLIESLDDYLHNRAAHPPRALLRHFAATPACSPELRDVILTGLAELGDEEV